MENNNRAGKGGGFVFFPRSYSIDQDQPSNSSASGVDIKGKKCTVYLRINDEALAASRSGAGKTVPDLARFSETHRKANNPCRSSPENCFESQEGVLLIEQAQVENKESRVYSGSWASVLREGSEGPKPEIGIGYMEIGRGKLTATVNQLMAEYIFEMKTSNNDRGLRAQEKILKIRAEIARQHKSWYIGVLVQYEQIRTYHTVSNDEFRSIVSDILKRNTAKGMYGGALLRVRNEEGVVSSNLSGSIDLQYDYKKSQVMDINAPIDNYLKFGGRKILSAVNKLQGVSIDFIPVVRINCGKGGNNKYNKDSVNSIENGGTPKLEKIFVDKAYQDEPTRNLKASKAFLGSKIGIRTAEIYGEAGKGNYLLSSLHAFSPPIGNIYELQHCPVRGAYKAFTLSR